MPCVADLRLAMPADTVSTTVPDRGISTMPKARKTRLYTREQGGVVRYYGDFRDFGDVGGKREALIPQGADRATSDEKLAQGLLAARLAELEAMRRRKQRGEPLRDATLGEYVAYHLTAQAKAGRVTRAWLEAAEMHLVAAIEFFCNGGLPLSRGPDGEPSLHGIRDRELGEIGVADVQDYVGWLASRPNGRGQTLSPSSQRKYLNSLSKLFRRAISERRLTVGHNPVAALIDKPQDRPVRNEADWLEVHEAALLLESARTYEPDARDRLAGTMYPLLATFLLTGGRPAEVLGLRVADISFERRTVTFRPNDERERLKTGRSWRTIRLWPQLEQILREYLESPRAPDAGGLLFPSGVTGKMLADVRKPLDRIAVRAGWRAGDIRPYAFRHTYCAARLQTLDAGHPVSPYTVGQELGHGGDSLVRRVYGHLGEVRHRSEVVEYRVEAFADRLAERIRKLRIVA